MRRSKAPSILNRKKPKLSGTGNIFNNGSVSDTNFNVKKEGKENSNIATNILKKDNNNRSKSITTKTNSDNNSVVDNKDEHNFNTRYYKVVWCKKSNKKHKNWEDDALLIVKENNSCILRCFDSETVLEKTSLKYQTSQNQLKEGGIVGVGSKEVEILSVLSYEDVKNIDLVEKGQKNNSNNNNNNNNNKEKENKKLQQNTQAVEIKIKRIPKLTSQKINKPKARHDPRAPGAIVLPDPSVEQQLEYKHFPLVDVVIDPYLAVHLRDHQIEGVKFLYELMCNNNGAILADEMGLGKTLQCITLLWTLLKQTPFFGKGNLIKRAVVVCPASLVQNWQKEFSKWLGNERINVFVMDEKKSNTKDFVQSRMYDVGVFSYESYCKQSKTLGNAKIDLLICDEGHRLKNGEIKTSKALACIPTAKRIIVSGTPLQNNLKEFYCMCDFVNPGIFGNYKEFRTTYEDGIARSKYPDCNTQEKQEGEDKEKQLQEIAGKFIIRRTAEVNDKYLPPKDEYVVFCKPTEKQIELYRESLKSNLFSKIIETGLMSASALQCISVLKKICNSVILHEQDSDLNVLDCEEAIDNSTSGKLMVLMDMLEYLFNNTNQKIVLVSNSTQMLDIFENLCNSRKYSFCRLDGGTPIDRRQPQVDLFNMTNQKEKFVFLLSAKAGGTGLNLVGANRLVMFDIDWNPATDAQAMARVWRDKQKRSVFIYRFITTGTIEEKIYQRQISKHALAGAVEEVALEKALFTKNDLKDLFQLNLHTDCDTHDLMGCDCDGKIAQNNKKKNKSDKTMCLSKLEDCSHFLNSKDVPDSCLSWCSKTDYGNISFAFHTKTQKEIQKED